MLHGFSRAHKLCLRSVLLIGSIALLSACASGDTASEKDKLTIGVPTLGTQTWLPNQATQIGNWVTLVNEPLLIRDTKNLSSYEIKPNLATSFEASPDASTWTFKLAPDVKFSNGSRLTSADVAYSIEMTMATGSQSIVAATLRGAIAEIRTPDPTTVVISLRNPDPEFAGNFTNSPVGPLIVDKEYVERVGMKEAGAKPIGTGPYVLKSQKSGLSATLTASESYRGSQPDFGTLELSVLSENANPVPLLNSGQLDIAQLSLENSKQLDTERGHIESVPGSGWYFMSLGGQYPGTKSFKESPWVSDPSDPAAAEKALMVREALSLAIDRKAILESLLGGHGELAAVPAFTPGSEYPPDSWAIDPFDPERAKQLLEQAGYARGFTIEMPEYNLTGRSELVSVGHTVADYWRRIGLTVNEQPADFATDGEAIAARTTTGQIRPMAFLFTPNPYDTLTSVTFSDSPYMYLAQTPELDALQEQYRKATTSDAKLATLQQIGDVLYENRYSVPLFTVDGLYGVSNSVGQWPQLAGSTYPTNVHLISAAE